ncbi:protein of unknown function [Vibrio tapetis subsp. tapetis]|uniref:Uncharacterized protein n=1 Tax=Vibrio tapetis subsp. tapetis TaxID=1671868 RepID=A0A2N8Z8B1_9VIBR|nr:protein of unknown function [Vibrio tapetis subsp. tapetis]
MGSIARDVTLNPTESKWASPQNQKVKRYINSPTSTKCQKEL